jgi:hypothetical protein
MRKLPRHRESEGLGPHAGGEYIAFHLCAPGVADTKGDVAATRETRDKRKERSQESGFRSQEKASRKLQA